MLEKTGVPSRSQLESKFPDRNVLLKPKAITECYEEIPCNPCSTSCPFEAITIGTDINTTPKVDFDLCTGCGICVYSCPGLAIFTVQIKDQNAVLKIPYEMHPLPDAGKRYKGLNREAEVVCDVFVERVTLSNRQDKTALLTISFPKEYIYDVITIGERL